MSWFHKLSMINKLFAMVVGISVGIAAVGALNYQSLQTVKVNGPHYQNLVMGKDLIADTLPPPIYITESFGAAHQILDDVQNESHNLQALLTRYRTTESEYNTRFDFWRKSNLNDAMKDVLLKETAEPANEFFKVMKTKFIPAAEKGDVETLQKLIRGELNALYTQQADAIAKLVKLTNEYNANVESIAATTVWRSTWLSIGSTIVLIAATLGLGLYVARQISANAREVELDAGAVRLVFEAVGKASTPEEAMRITLNTVKENFGWAYGSYWSIDPNENVLKFSMESGTVNPEFRRVTQEARFREGEGLSGRAWRSRDLVFTADIGEMTDCCRAAIAKRSGVKSGICFPIVVRGNVIATMDFFVLEAIHPSVERLNSLRTIGNLVSSAIERLEKEVVNTRFAGMMNAQSASVTFADKDFKIVYANGPALEMLKKVEKHLPVKVDQIVGQNMDIFHKNPAQQRKVLSDPKNTPVQAQMTIGDEVFDLVANSVFDDKKQFLGTVVSWVCVTEKLTNERRIKEATERERTQQEELRAKVDSMLDVVNAAAASDLTRTVEVNGSDAIGQMGEGLEKFLTDLRRSISGIADNAIVLSGASEELSAVSSQMSTNAKETSSQATIVSAASEQVCANIQLVSASVEEMSATVKEIAKNASDAARVASSAVQVADVTNRTISKLGTSSEEIGKVIKVINSIAEQTNLLALNATIEAARAGEAGKGFAVVANEVKELAKETAKATEDIAQKIDAIQRDTHGAVEAIGEITSIINQVNDISNSIASSVEEQAATTAEIGRNVIEATLGSSEIARNISAVAKAAENTTEGAANTQRAGEELSRMATELHQLVGKFRYHTDAEQADKAKNAPKPAPAKRPAAPAASPVGKYRLQTADERSFVEPV
ncbi:MAG: methyl-accepting chemotaxis protein [Planctomycetaceae bacterium]